MINGFEIKEFNINEVHLLKDKENKIIDEFGNTYSIRPATLTRTTGVIVNQIHEVQNLSSLNDNQQRLFLETSTKKIRDEVLFDQWYNGFSTGINNFTKSLFELYTLADYLNKEKLKIGFPEYFSKIKTV